MRKTICIIVLALSAILINLHGRCQGTWSQKVDYPGGEIYLGCSFVINGESYVGKGINRTDFYKYNPVSESWQPIATELTVGNTIPLQMLVACICFIRGKQVRGNIYHW
jgi:hypothetical protein